MTSLRASQQIRARLCQVPQSRRPFSCHLHREGRTRLQAKRREIEPVYFADLYDSLLYTVEESTTAVPNKELTVLVESISKPEHVPKVLQLLERQIVNRENEVDDWHIRKQQYISFFVQCIRHNSTDVMYNVLSDLDKYRISTYFPKDLIAELGSLKADKSILKKILSIVEMQRTPDDKGLRGAYYELLSVLKKRKLDNDFIEVYEGSAAADASLPEGMKKYYSKLKGANTLAVAETAAA